MISTRRCIAVLGTALLASFGPAMAAPLSFELPETPFTLKPGPDSDVAEANCAACHSSDYITTQPRGLANPTAFWTGEVVKMQKAYGAPIADADIAKIVAYLVATYGKAGS